MKKVVSVILCIFIFAIPLFCFADTIYTDSPEPAVLPEGDSDSTTGLYVITGQNENYYVSSGYPVYLIYFRDPNYNFSSRVFFSDSQDSVVYAYNSTNGTRSTISLNNYYNGYYYSAQGAIPSNFPIYLKEGATVENVIDDVNNSVFSVTFSLTSLTNEAVSWLSAVVDGVLQAPMLLFLILVPFIGVAVGLLFRFRRG